MTEGREQDALFCIEGPERRRLRLDMPGRGPRHMVPEPGPGREGS